jgi:CubicO group peptidase (beta-lactamase class C family)
MFERCLRMSCGMAIVLLSVLTLYAQTKYFPPAGNWERREPQQLNIDDNSLKRAIAFAIANESKTPRNLELAHFQTFGREPFGEPVGPFRERGPASGLIIKSGYIVAEWGEPARIDMAFSVTKSFLSATAAVALDKKLIRSFGDRITDYWTPTLVYEPGRRFDRGENFGRPTILEPFESENNQKITWEHLLRQTSDWEGTLWGKPDWADRPDRDVSAWLSRQRNEPGTAYEYNDVRVNLLALCLLNVWRRPLPEVLKKYVMDEIGASDTWRWFGYENSYVVIDGNIVQSVSGGGHWGGGIFINSYDMGRFGLLTLRNGTWNSKQILPADFIAQAKTPTVSQPTYGFMNWFLNTDRKLFPSAPAKAFAHIGNGTNLIYVDPDNDLVAVVRWIENGKIDEFLGLLTIAVSGSKPKM